MSESRGFVEAAAADFAARTKRDRERLASWPALVATLEKIAAEDNRAGQAARDAAAALVGIVRLR